MTTPGTRADPYDPPIDIDGAQYFPEPYSVPWLPYGFKVGLIPVAALATLSVGCTSWLIAVIVNRLFVWRRKYQTWAVYNHIGSGKARYWLPTQLALLKDGFCTQAMSVVVSSSRGSFSTSIDWLAGFFVLAIAVHTWWTAVYGRLISGKTFARILLAIWFAVYFLTAIGVAIHGHQKYFTAAGAWCWVSPAYELDRLWLHYFWIFAIQFGTVLLYLSTYITLRKKTTALLVDGEVPPNSPNGRTIKSIKRITKLMTLYPCVYILLTLPLSAGRMWSMSNGGQPTSSLFSCIAGSFMTSCGWVDTLLYTLTRKQLLRDTMSGTFHNRTGTILQAAENLSKEIFHSRRATVQTTEAADSEQPHEMLDLSSVTPPRRNFTGDRLADAMAGRDISDEPRELSRTASDQAGRP